MAAPAVNEAIGDNTANASSLPSRTAKQQRILACTVCQQRKVKCDRNLPCSNCVKSRVKCVPATLAPRQRRRRFSERALIERIRRYEDLLRENQIRFEPLHPPRQEEESRNLDDSDASIDELAGRDTSYGSTGVSKLKTTGGHAPRSFYQAMNQAFRDPKRDSESFDDDLRETTVKQLWDHEVESDQHLLFGCLPPTIELSVLHPDPIQILRLWQVYIDNVNPLLKVSHIPSLQSRIIEAASNITIISPVLEALMFSVYCVSILSLSVEDCQTMFAASRHDLLSRYQAGCQQALWSCGFLRTSDRDCLTALFLYLTTLRSNMLPPTLSSMLSIAIRIAQRMGLHCETANAKYTPFEAEMRRRLWWALMLYDTRITELAGSTAVTLNPTWDCKTPLNVNESDLRPEMNTAPTPHAESTDAVFAVVRSELGEYMRHTAFSLNFGNAALRPIAKHFQKSSAPDSDHLVKLEEMLESQYLKFCDEENPIHFMTIWSLRAQLAKYNMLEYNLRLATSSSPHSEVQYDAATRWALRMLECDTKVMTSPLTKRFLWLGQLNFPFPAYFHVTQDLRRRASKLQAQQAWDIMSANWDGWSLIQVPNHTSVFQMFAKMIIQTWEACECAGSESNQDGTRTPRIIVSVKNILAQIERDTSGYEGRATSGNTDIQMDRATGALHMLQTSAGQNFLPYNLGVPTAYGWWTPGGSSDTGSLGQGLLGNDMNTIDWGIYDRLQSWGSR